MQSSCGARHKEKKRGLVVRRFGNLPVAAARGGGGGRKEGVLAVQIPLRTKEVRGRSVQLLHSTQESTGEKGRRALVPHIK